MEKSHFNYLAKVAILPCLLLLLTISYPNAVFAYWQQELHYDIKVELDDSSHILKAFMKLDYVNLSPDTLEYIYFHLWPNAYSNVLTDFAEQQLRNKSTRFYYSEADERGGINGLSFVTGDQELTLEYHPEKPDIAKLLLNKPLLPGESVTVSTPFIVDIPKSFSRLGHIGQSYQITQWYPKPAVYDEDGWQPMAYLDQGEFYSEYGSFKVAITLPSNYVVGATGNLQNEDELAWLDSLAIKTANKGSFKTTNKIPASSEEMKTLVYVQDNIHDFAWFADKRFHVLKGEVQLPNSGRTVTTWAMFTNRDAEYWTKSIDYINGGLMYYSRRIGDYPYDHCTAVEGALSAGAGMEYPMVTIIGGVSSDKDLETVIVHEVGHNWFQGVLGSNEREYPWLDEGINSFYEMQYLMEEHPDWKLVGDFANSSFADFLNLAQYPWESSQDLFYKFTASRNVDQPIEMTSEDYSFINYGAIVYMKAALAMNYLQEYLTPAIFDRAMQKYYKYWSFRHPDPDDLQTVMEDESGKDLTWFFDHLLPSTDHLDYKMGGWKQKKDKDNDGEILFAVKNAGQIAGPFPVSAMKDGEIVRTVWYEGFEDSKELSFPDGDYDMLRIDAGEDLPEHNRQNNTLSFKGLSKRTETFRLQLFTSMDDPYKTELMFMPVLSWNNADQLMVGMLFYNHSFPFKKFEYTLMPMYATGTNEPVGVGRISYHFYPRKKLEDIVLSVSGRRFSTAREPEGLQFYKIAPQLTIVPKSDRKKDEDIKQSLTLRSVIIGQEFRQFNTETDQKELVDHRYVINEVTYAWRNDRVLNPFGFEMNVSQGNTFVRATATLNYTLSYSQKGKGLMVRVFAGGFVLNDGLQIDDEKGILPPNSDLTLSGNPVIGNVDGRLPYDFTYDKLFFDRNGDTKLFSRQVMIDQGGFRSMMASVGQSDSWLITANITSTIPRKIPLRPFLNVGAGKFPAYNPNKKEIKDINLVAELGISIVALPEILEIHIPFVTTNNIKYNQENVLGYDKFWQKITFTFDLRKVNLMEQLDKMF